MPDNRKNQNDNKQNDAPNPDRLPQKQPAQPMGDKPIKERKGDKKIDDDNEIEVGNDNDLGDKDENEDQDQVVTQRNRRLDDDDDDRGDRDVE